MTIHHILKDGTEVPTVAGHVVPAKGHEALYQMITERKKTNEESNQGDV